MAEGFPGVEHDTTDVAVHEDEEQIGEDGDKRLTLSDDIAKSILESEEWPSYVERLRQAGDDDENTEGMLLAERFGRQYPLWNANHRILDDVDPPLPTGCLDVEANLPSPCLTEDDPLPAPSNNSLRADDASSPTSLLLQHSSRKSVSDSREATSFTPDPYSRSSSRSAFLTSPFNLPQKLDIIEENKASRERKQSSSSKPLGTPGSSALRFLLGRSGSRNPESSPCAKGPITSKNSKEWSPDIEQLRAALISSGSSGEGDLFKSSFRISKSGSSILALERIFLEVVEASSQHQLCLAQIQGDIRSGLPSATLGDDSSALRRAVVPSSAKSKGLPLQRLGRGAFGRVFGVQIKGRLVAVKDVRNVDEPSERNASQLVHRHVVRTLCVAPLEPRRFLVVMEYGGPHTLQHLLDERGPLLTYDVCRFGRQLASALHYCHRNNVLHLDVKPSNVLVHNGDCKLADFGSSATRGSQPKVCGTVQYMAPEVLLGQRPEFSADVYSLGVVLWQMQSGVRPFDGLHQHAVMFQVVRLRVRPSFAENHGAPELQDLVKRCWSHECEERPSVGAVLLELGALHKATLKSRSRLQ
ncbi:proto-oncogene serine/threonine-protein kinase mos [Dermacentor variabilis]|uniref:proto-oncogene serine/threonine-protein kinase mos n=1 Tax=Dermacentor variabilis TaxID=34621 RepID=UPI003F5CA6C0